MQLHYFDHWKLRTTAQHRVLLPRRVGARRGYRVCSVRRSSGIRFGYFLALAVLVASCGGRIDRSEEVEAGGDYADGGGANGTIPGNGGGSTGGNGSHDEDPSSGGHKGDNVEGAGASTAADQEEEFVCAPFLTLWKVRQSELAPGDVMPPPGADAPCYECIQRHKGLGLCTEPVYDECYPGSSCVERHCLCRAGQSFGRCEADDLPENMCQCVQSCMRAGSDPCRPQWLDYMRCLVDACAERCE